MQVLTMMSLLASVSEAAFKVSLRRGLACLPPVPDRCLAQRHSQWRKGDITAAAANVCPQFKGGDACKLWGLWGPSSEVADESCKRHKQECEELTDTFSPEFSSTLGCTGNATKSDGAS